MNVENVELASDRKLGVVIYRADVAAVYRYLRDHGRATGEEIAEACFPLTFGRADPLFKRLFRKSMAKALLSIGYLRGAGVTITCLSTPGDLSKFVLGAVPQGPEAFSVTGKVSQVGDLMGEDVWHEGSSS